MHAVWGKLLANRIINQCRCLGSYALSLIGIVRVKHMPTFVSIEPANFCNLHCPECPVGNPSLRHNTHPPAQCMSMDLFRHILSQIQSTAHTIQFYFQGEPLLNTQLPEMIRLAHQSGLYTIVSTNAQLLTPQWAERLVTSGLNRIIISIDGFTESSYSAYRQGGDLHRAMAGLVALRQAKVKHSAHLLIELQVLRLRTNENEWTWIRHHYRRMGADRLVFKTAQLYHYTHGHPLLPTHPRYARYRLGADGLYHLHRPSHRSCYRLWSGCVITTTGEVLPCCYDKDSAYSYGNILTAPLRQLWTPHRSPLTSQHASICKECYY